MKSDTVPVEKESEHASAFPQFIDSIQDASTGSNFSKFILLV
jgi:hypothetical protein